MRFVPASPTREMAGTAIAGAPSPRIRTPPSVLCIKVKPSRFGLIEADLETDEALIQRLTGIARVIDPVPTSVLASAYETFAFGVRYPDRPAPIGTEPYSE
jgi:hypothetical protein